jgi:hypothetical protein
LLTDVCTIGTRTLYSIRDDDQYVLLVSYELGQGTV